MIGPGLPDRDAFDELAARATESIREESLLARILADRLRRQNMFSWNRIELPDRETPYTIFNGQVFSTYGFSYLSPLVNWKKGTSKPTPCPVLIDVYQGACIPAQVDSFRQRIERATYRGRSQLRSLGIIAAKDFEQDAWKQARREGLVTISLR